MSKIAAILLLQICIIQIVAPGINADTMDELSEISKQAENKKTDSSKGGDTDELVDVLDEGHFFQDIFAESLAPFKIQFGHVCENPDHWEQRFEQKDFENNRHQGKIKWGDKNGAYGEHYWDLNH